MKSKTTRFILSVLAYLVLSMIMVSLWHFVIFKDHYESISIVRAQPLMQLGMAAMVIQGCVLAYLFPSFRGQATGSPLVKGIKFGLLMGLFLGAYLSLAEPGKYNVPSISNWIMIEGVLSLLQFTVVGAALGLINKE